MALVSMSHRVTWAPPSVTEVAADEELKVDQMLESESSEVTDDMVK